MLLFGTAAAGGGRVTPPAMCVTIQLPFALLLGLLGMLS